MKRIISDKNGKNQVEGESFGQCQSHCKGGDGPLGKADERYIIL